VTGRAAFALAASSLALVLPGCSPKRMAARAMSDSLAAIETSFAADADPDLVREALPFSLKSVEALLEESPRDPRLLRAAASGFTRYAFGFLRPEADAASDPATAARLRERAVALYLRGRGYGLRGLGLDLRALRVAPDAALARLEPRQVAFAYWTAAAWGGAIELAAGDPALAADQPVAAALMARSLALDETFEAGAGHDFFIAYEARRRAAGGSLEEARKRLERSVELSGGRRAWPFVIHAETAAVAAQDRRDFERRIGQALAIDAGAVPERRLENLLAQRRARWLQSRVDELFVE
jgi:predicted anti-sigma-YlaC factor YlaD